MQRASRELSYITYSTLLTSGRQRVRLIQQQESDDYRSQSLGLAGSQVVPRLHSLALAAGSNATPTGNVCNNCIPVVITLYTYIRTWSRNATQLVALLPARQII